MTTVFLEMPLYQLESVFDYYSLKASLDVAKHLVTSIVNKTILLESNPAMGPIEELLRHRKNEYVISLTEITKSFTGLTNTLSR